MISPVDRRRFLAGALAGLAAFGAGCTDTTGNSDTTRGSTEPTTNDESVSGTDTARRPTVSTVTRGTDSTACEEALQRLPSKVNGVEYGSLNGFSLTANRTTLSIGDSIVFRLRNETDTETITGNRHKFDVQRRLDDEWRSIYWMSDSASYTDMGYGQQPGEGFTWRFALTRQGLEHTSQTNPPYRVCEALVPGDYRFVYWGVSAEGENETDRGVGVRFELTKPNSTVSPDLSG